MTALHHLIEPTGLASDLENTPDEVCVCLTVLCRGERCPCGILNGVDVRHYEGLSAIVQDSDAVSVEDRHLRGTDAEYRPRTLVGGEHHSRLHPVRGVLCVGAVCQSLLGVGRVQGSVHLEPSVGQAQDSVPQRLGLGAPVGVVVGISSISRDEVAVDLSPPLSITSDNAELASVQSHLLLLLPYRGAYPPRYPATRAVAESPDTLQRLPTQVAARATTSEFDRSTVLPSAKKIDSLGATIVSVTSTPDAVVVNTSVALWVTLWYCAATGAGAPLTAREPNQFC